MMTAVSSRTARAMRRWVLAEPAPPEFLAAFPELPTLVAQLCYHRDLRTQAAVDEFLHPDYGKDLHDPFLFRDMARAVDRILRARDAGERVVVYGDYDADGVSGATILAETLTAIGCTVDVFVPHRERDGYGVNLHALEEIIAGGVRLLITCDCGIANVREVARAQEFGVDVIITDHHVFGAELPPAYAIIHPLLPGETYPYHQLTGGGVAFKLCQALVQRERTSGAPRVPEGFEKWLLDCVAISTIADFGRLIGENRTLVTFGLVVLAKTRRPGLRALYEVARIRPERITPATIGFQIAPRINAAGRINHANEALALLRASDPIVARALAEKLHATNTERQRLVEEASEQAIVQVGDVGHRRLLTVVGDGWLPGIVGLVATKLRDRFHRPALVVTRREGKLVGSGRSIEGLHIVEALRSVADLLVSFGGHPQACGFTLTGEDAVRPFTERLETYARERLTEEQRIPTLAIDGELRLAEITWELVEHLDRFGPFGIGNPTPRYLACGVTVDGLRVMGNTGKHLRLQVRQVGNRAMGTASALPHPTSQTPDARHKMIVFCYEDVCPAVRVGDVVDVVFEVDQHEWNGNREIQMKVVDMRPVVE